MKRWKRITLEILGPPALGAILWWMAFVIGSARMAAASRATSLSSSEKLGWLIVLLLYAYAFAGLPSLIYAAIMEWRFARGLDPRSWRAVALSAGLGLLSGMAMPAVFTGGHTGAYALPAWGLLGLAVGVLLGAIIRWRESAARKSRQ